MIYITIQKLINYALKNDLITQDDIYVVRNQLMEIFKLSNWEETDTEYTNETIDEILEFLIDYACKNGIITDTANSHDLFDTKIMGILTPMPREVISKFYSCYKISPKQATDWYYKFSCDTIILSL